MLEIRGNMGECKSEDQDFKKTWGRASLRKKTLKNRKEDFRSKVLKNTEKKLSIRRVIREKKQ
jgi:hypothetical protein